MRLAALAIVAAMVVGCATTPAEVVDHLERVSDSLGAQMATLEGRLAEIESDPTADAEKVREYREALEAAERERALIDAKLARLQAEGDDLGWLKLIGAALGSAAMAFLGVEMRRGSPSNRKGTMPIG